MTVEDLREMFVEDNQDCYIYGLESGVELFSGSMRDIPEDLLYEEISSLDNIYKGTGEIGINIDK